MQYKHTLNNDKLEFLTQNVVTHTLFVKQRCLTAQQ